MIQQLLDLTRAELAEYADFDEDGFVLRQVPAAEVSGIELGRYELPRRSGEAHMYRVGHPLAEWVTSHAKARTLPMAKLVFDYAAYGNQISTLKGYRGKGGWLSVTLVSVDALGCQEQRLLVAATTYEGSLLEEDDPEKLLRLPARLDTSAVLGSPPDDLQDAVVNRRSDILREINQRNLGYFEQEVLKLDAWADDLKLGLEQEIKEIDYQIKEVRRLAAAAATLDEKLASQRQQRDLESKRTRLRRELFLRQDEIEAQRNQLIEQVESRLSQRVENKTLFVVAWDLE